MASGNSQNPTSASSFASRQPTGDAAVDDVLDKFEAVSDEPLDSRIEAGELVHRVLQGRLADLGQE